MADDSKTYPNVTEDLFACIKTKSKAEHGTVYDPPDADTGTATTKTIVGTVVLTFALDTTQSTLTYTIKSKPAIVQASQIWDGIASTIKECS